MRKFAVQVGLVAFCLLVITRAATAASITITFGGGGNNGFTHSFSGSLNDAAVPDVVGLTLTVSPYSTVNDASEWDIKSDDDGYGVDNGRGDDHEIDSALGYDGLRFTFNSSVNLTTIVFGNWGSFNRAQIFRGPGSFVYYDGEDENYSPAGGLNDSQFFIQAVDNLEGGDSSFRVRSITFDYTTQGTGDPVPAPEPATLLLTGLGMTVMAARARRMRRAK